MVKSRRGRSAKPQQRGTTVTRWEPSPRTPLIGTCIIFLLHCLGLVLIFSPSSGIISDAPLIEQDWGLHLHHLKSLEAFWRQDNQLWGYNPFFMAGYPSNTIQDLSIKLFEFVAIGLATIVLSPLQVFKLCAFLAMASVPWLMYFAAKNFFFADGAKNTLALAAPLLGTVYWWNSLPREMFFYGMIGFPAASYLSIVGVSLFYRLAVSESNSRWLCLSWLSFAVAIPALHVQSTLIFMPPMIALLAAQPRLTTRRLLVAIGVAAMCSAFANSPWLIPALQHYGDDMSAGIVEQLPLFAGADAFTFILDYVGLQGYWTFRPSFMEKGFRLSLLILGVVGTWILLQSERWPLGRMLASALMVLFLVAYFGAFLPLLKPWQPLRFKVAFDLFLVIGAAHCVSHWLVTPARPRFRLVPLVLSMGLIAFAINIVQTESTGRLLLRSRLTPPLEAITQWIAREAPADARVLFEESGDETGFVYDGVYLSSLLPHLTGRELIGGPINLYNDRHHFAEFHSGKMFKKNVQTLSADEVINHFRLYNIGAVVAFHPASLQRLQSIPGLVTVKQRIGPIHLMKVNQPPSWFLQGLGKLTAGFNRIELAELKGSEIILKYHWIEGLRSTPTVKIIPVKLADDPIPFIKLVDPPSNLTLRIGP